MKTREREKDSRDSILLMLLILLLGFICIIVTSGWALRFAPSWKLPANMRSNLNPDSDFLTGRPAGFIEPIDPAILTPPDWVNVFLTPGSTFLTRTPLPTNPVVSNTPAITQTSVPVFTVTASPANTLVPTNTLIYFPPPPATLTATKKPKPPTVTPAATSTPTATSIAVLSADLGITKTDNATDYAPNISVQYIIVASNSGPSDVISATVSDIFSTNPNLTGMPTWTCTASPGASCTAGGSGDINDTVALSAGSSIQYTVNVTASSSPSGSLSNTVTINSSVPDPNPGNNSASDIPADTLITANPLPSPVGNIPAGTYAEYSFATPFVVGPSSYLVYYPQYLGGATVDMDLVILQVSDGKNWYTILNWGDTSLGNNGDIPSASLCSGSETDNCPITIAGLTNQPGITITGIPAGTYPYIRIISPPDSGDGVDVDNIAVFP